MGLHTGLRALDRDAELLVRVHRVQDEARADGSEEEDDDGHERVGLDHTAVADD